MKRIAHFFLVSVIFLIIAYMQPIIFPDDRAPKPLDIGSEVPDEKGQKFMQGKVSSTGLSQYIGQKAEAFVQNFGEPIEIQEVDNTSSWWIFGEDGSDYLQLLIEDKVIQSIFVLGTGIECDYFNIGMTLHEMSSVTTLYSNFSFQQSGKDYVVELTEKDMSTQPLVAFDNESFAILHIDGESEKVTGIRYLNTASLLSLMPYNLQEGELPESKNNESDVSEVSQRHLERQFFSLVNLIREREGKEIFVANGQLFLDSSELLTSFLDEKETYLEKEALEELALQRNIQTYRQPFYLTQKEIEKIAKENKISLDNTYGLAYTPTRDIPYMLMQWYGKLLPHLPLNQIEQGEIGVSFKDDFILLMLRESPSEETATSDEGK
ncbi:CAP-associated domain-containing protein [Vagococcus elongatus]|uniref:CAP-associated domain-containing protein n=1 Tax=Vagococcus elongatus TaxID=180344 RepID=UPI001476A560|nr:CAP-associated domain-containing protein [Vagococcus elongatus]